MPDKKDYRPFVFQDEVDAFNRGYYAGIEEINQYALDKGEFMGAWALAIKLGPLVRAMRNEIDKREFAGDIVCLFGLLEKMVDDAEPVKPPERTKAWPV